MRALTRWWIKRRHGECANCHRARGSPGSRATGGDGRCRWCGGHVCSEDCFREHDAKCEERPPRDGRGGPWRGRSVAGKEPQDILCRMCRHPSTYSSCDTCHERFCRACLSTCGRCGAVDCDWCGDAHDGKCPGRPRLPLRSMSRELCDVWDTQSSWTTDEELQDLIKLAERAAARHEDDRALLDP